MYRMSGILFILLWFLASGFASGADPLAPGTEVCLECHADTVDPSRFTGSAHRRLTCSSCHLDVDLDTHPSATVPAAVGCTPCHRTETETYRGSLHRAQGLGCVDCHRDIHALPPWNEEKRAVIDLCRQCHEAQDYVVSVHGQAVLRGNRDAPACIDCHGLHATTAVSGPHSRQNRSFFSDPCIPCHSDEDRMRRNEVSPAAVRTFIASYHGKSYRLGSPELTAGCADCHGSHQVLPQTDPRSSLHSFRRAATCAVCHPGASDSFAKFFAHADPTDRQRYPVLFWTYVGMTGLLVGVFGLFWLHSLLWLLRGFVENRARRLDPEPPERQLTPAGHKRYRRFRPRYIILHLIVIVSFLGLSLTGLPLKFSDQTWARQLMEFFGGVQLAGLLHRACAVLTFYYFIAALLCSIEFLFFAKRKQGTLLQRLFGPESLMPNFKDLRDVRDMIKWFFFRGPKPAFDKWTYWEKFDFLAVFWGMFAIGGSGLMLWFPEIFGSFLPGWMFNVATIIHSDEALLATGFIFTVHFFNTHCRPEKFPMDFTIFDGQISEHEFRHERPVQWERYREQGLTEELEVGKPCGVLYELFFRSFGFGAVVVGLLLAGLMLVAFLAG